MGGSGPVGFDLDMTLINSRPAILASFAETARETGTAIDLDAVDRRLGVKLDDELAFWFPPGRVAAAAGIYRRHYLRLADQMTTVLPGAHEALATVRAAGQRAVIITAKHPVSAGPSLRAAGLAPDELFTLVHGPEKAAVLRRLKAVAYVGDTPPDMAAAVQAGVVPFGLDTLLSDTGLSDTGLSDTGRDGRHDLVRQVPRVHEQRPGYLADPRPERGQRLLALPPGGRLVAAEPGRDVAPEPARVTAVRPPGRQPCAQLVVAGRHRPVPQPLGDLTRRIDDERPVTAALDAVYPALGTGTVPDAGRAEPGSDGQRGHRVAGFVPGRPHRRRPGRGVAGRGPEDPEVVTLPDPDLVHDGLVVVADEPGQFGLDPGQGPGLRGRHRGDRTQNSLPSGSASTVHGTSPWAP